MLITLLVTLTSPRNGRHFVFISFGSTHQHSYYNGTKLKLFCRNPKFFFVKSIVAYSKFFHSYENCKFSNLSVLGFPGTFLVLFWFLNGKLNIDISGYIFRWNLSQQNTFHNDVDLNDIRSLLYIVNVEINYTFVKIILWRV